MQSTVVIIDAFINLNLVARNKRKYYYLFLYSDLVQ